MHSAAILGEISQQPGTHCSLLIALEAFLTPPQIVMLRGEQTVLPVWQTALLPHTLRAVTVALPAGLADLPNNLNKPLPVGEKAGTCVCEDRWCLPEIRQLGDLLAVIALRR
ncbi:MAG TPA: hypothetical protein PKG49_04060 [Nitrosomonas mobilis]|nr:hypothetical protein [Nitrosomonas mobilis]